MTSKILCTALLGLFCSVGSAVRAEPATAPTTEAVKLDIPAQPLQDALAAFGRQTGLEIVYASADVTDALESPQILGTYTPREALAKILSRSELTFEYINARTVAIRKGSTVPSSSAVERGRTDVATAVLAQPDGPGTPDTELPNSVAGGSDAEQAANRPAVRLDEVVVTGSHIRNADPLSPLITMTHDEMVAQGYTRLDEAIAQLPQNYGAISQISNSVINNAPGAVSNQTIGSNVDLRGLGSGSTLVLLNGRRLPLSAYGLTADISAIPLSAIDRVEIMTDGASAVYGSDAIGGVVNIITVKQFSGLEMDLKSTGITAGKTPNYQGGTTGGLNWAGGNVLATVGYEKDSPLLTTERTFTTTTPPELTYLSPWQESTNGYIGLHQSLTAAAQLSADVLGSSRRFFIDSNNFGTVDTVSGRADQIALSVQLDYELPAHWQLSLIGQLPQEKDFIFNNYPAYGVSETDHYTNFTPSIEARVNGDLLELPGGTLRAAVGGSFRKERFEWETDAAPDIARQRHVTSQYLELLVPLVAESNRVPLVEELQLDLAGRRDDYSDFGSAATPKISARWKMTDEIDWHGSFSRSFKAPTLYEQYFVKFGNQAAVTDPSSPTGETQVLFLDGGNPDLTAEHSRSLNFGVTYQPELVSGLKVNASWFSIDYSQKIDELSNELPFTSVLQDAAALGPQLMLHPTLAQVNQALAVPGLVLYSPVDAASIGAIANLGYANVGLTTVRGWDTSIRYTRSTPIGQLTGELAGSYFDEYHYRITPTAEQASFIGTTWHPPRVRSKLNVGWSRGEWGANGRVNFVGAYKNPDDPACSAGVGCPVSPWTTVDVGVSYSPAGADRPGLLHGLRLSLEVGNLFDRKPPHLALPAFDSGINYDPVNANPFERVLAISLTKRWGARP